MISSASPNPLLSWKSNKRINSLLVSIIPMFRLRIRSGNTQIGLLGFKKLTRLSPILAGEFYTTEIYQWDSHFRSQDDAGIDTRRYIHIHILLPLRYPFLPRILTGFGYFAYFRDKTRKEIKKFRTSVWLYGLKLLREDNNNLIMSHSEIYPSDVDIIDYDIFVHIWTIEY